MIAITVRTAAAAPRTDSTAPMVVQVLYLLQLTRSTELYVMDLNVYVAGRSRIVQAACALLVFSSRGRDPARTRDVTGVSDRRAQPLTF
jgi:hypothetical protein